MTYPLLIAEPPFQVLPALAKAVGFNEAAVLQVIHYWLSPEVNVHFREGRHWVPNVSDLLRQRFFFWDEETTGYILAQLEQSGVLIASQESSEMKCHTIDYELLKGRDGAPVTLMPVTPFIQDILPKANKNRRHSFMAKVHVKSLNLYVMEAQDLAHFLECELILEIQKNKSGQKASEDKAGQEAITPRKVICHFPRIANEKLRELSWDDITLHGILMIMFQMKIMEQLLVFCTTHHAANLVIFADDDQADELGIYRDFLACKDKTFASREEKREMAIPADPETFDAWLDFMEEVTIRFRQILWRDQKTNPAIQHYLKAQDLEGV